MVKNSNSENRELNAPFIAITGIVVTLIVTPSISFDPINLPKMCVLTLGAILLLPNLWASRYKLPGEFMLLGLISVFLVILNFFFTSGSNFQKFYGVWGRSTGALTYLGFFVVLFAAASLVEWSSRRYILVLFRKLSYIVTTYTVLQLMDLDPINWSSREPVATLGNINFMSSFLGLASILIFFEAYNSRKSFFSFTNYLFWIVTNLGVIWISGSLQGIAVFAAGVTIQITFHIRKMRPRISILYLVASVSLGTLLLIGTFGSGPFGARLIQNSALFRLDYWRAGLKMSLDNPFFGVGFDSYGDYYRLYRDQTAASRTGPQRVSNTAHNLFLDISTGAGLPMAIAFICILILLTWKLLKMQSDIEPFQQERVLYLSLIAGLLIFYTISIHQIGIGIWGMIFLGLAISLISNYNSRSLIRESRLKSKSAIAGKNVLDYTATFKLSHFPIFLVLSFILAAIICFVPAKSDVKMLHSLKTRDRVELSEVGNATRSALYLREFYLDNLMKSGELNTATVAAKTVLSQYPRSYLALSIISFSEYSSLSEKNIARTKLLQQDPWNFQLKEQLQKE